MSGAFLFSSPPQFPTVPPVSPLKSQSIPVAIAADILLNHLEYDFLIYLKLRKAYRNHYGSFRLDEKACKATGLSLRNLRYRVNRLIKNEFVSQHGDNPDLFHIISMDDYYKPSRRNFYLKDSILDTLSWKNIAKFRGMLTELAIQNNQNVKALLEKLQSWGYIDQRDKAYHKIRKPRPKKTKFAGKKVQTSDLVSLSVASRLVGKSKSTLSRYREENLGVADYTRNIKTISLQAPDPYTLFLMNERSMATEVLEERGRYFINQRKWLCWEGVSTRAWLG